MQSIKQQSAGFNACERPGTGIRRAGPLRRLIELLQFFGRHWRLVFARRSPENDPERSGSGLAKLRTFAIYFLVFGVPLVIGSACGVAAWLINERLKLEVALEQNSVTVSATILHAHVWRYGEPPLSSDTANRRHLVCYLDIRYPVAGASTPHEAVVTPFVDPNGWMYAQGQANRFRGSQPHCGSFKQGGALEIKYLPEQPDAFALEGAPRIEASRITILFAMAIVLAGLPLLVLLIGLVQHLSAGKQQRS